MEYVCDFADEDGFCATCSEDLDLYYDDDELFDLDYMNEYM